MRQAVEDPRVLWYCVLLRKLLSARHYGEPLSAENPVRSVPPTRQDMLRAGELQSENNELIGTEGIDREAWETVPRTSTLRHRAHIIRSPRG